MTSLSSSPPPSSQQSSPSSMVAAMMSNCNDMPVWILIILEFSSWRERSALMMLSKRWWYSTHGDYKFYRFLCTRLSVEHLIYIPSTIPTKDTWRSVFLDMYHLRSLWFHPDDDATGSAHGRYDNSSINVTAEKYRAPIKERFKISVYARFRPSDAIMTINSTRQADSKSVIDAPQTKPVEIKLPLHQRLSMIRLARNLTSTKEALKVLASEGDWFEKKWESIITHKEESIIINEKEKAGQGGSSGMNEKSIGGNKDDAADEGDCKENVYSSGNNNNNNNYIPNRSNKNGSSFDADQRVPSFMDKLYRAQQAASQQLQPGSKGGYSNNNKGSSMTSCVSSVDPLTSRVVVIAPDVGLREFTYDAVFNEKASQRSLYDSSMKRLVMDFINGFNSTAIVYGQTGSGKSYSMFGKDELSITGRNAEGKGLVPRACEEIFTAIETRRRLDRIDAQVYVSYIEVFGDQVSDLLTYGARCGHSKVSSQRYVLSGAAEKTVHSMNDIESILRAGEQQKRRASTAMNDRSSRAHSLFIVTLKQTHLDRNVTINSRLFMADLGGSEQVKKSQVHAGTNREGLQEQFSLGFELGEHMREAVNINLGLLALKKCIESLNARSLYTPYQDSKLTMLLSEGLGGNSKTSIIVCANMDPSHVTETIATLRFGERCALIENSARNNATMLASVLANLDQQIAALEAEITKKEKWELRNEHRDDVLAEEGTFEKMSGAVEIKKVYVLVGAEIERQQLERLLLQRAKFVGSSADDDDHDDDHHDSQGTMLDNSLVDGVNQKQQQQQKGKGKSKVVVGFGKEYATLYGLGEKFDESNELLQGNSRFEGQVDAEETPAAVKALIGNRGWESALCTSAEDLKKLELKAKKIKRSKLAYSGISA